MREKKEINVQVGHQIRKAREAAGLTQERFAELIGISPQNVSCVERGLAGVSLTVLPEDVRDPPRVQRSAADGRFGRQRCGDPCRPPASAPPEQFRVVQEILNRVLELTSLPQ